jgi:plasmid stability protein
MATLTIKNIPDDLYEKLKFSAEANRRSINSEVIVLIERAFRSHKPSPEEIQERARRLREMTAHCYLTEEELNRAKNEGRP